MAKQTINIGTVANDGTGDTLRASLDKCNDNFDELYTLTDGTGAASVLTLSAGSAYLADTVISDTTPQLSLKDSSCAVADVNALIKADATDTGDGTEDIDVTFQQQVAGLITTFLVSDADGSLTLGQANQPIVLNGPVGDVTMKDASPTLLLIDSDAADGDAGVSIAASATATGAGAENVDLTITQQISGAAANVFVADADGDITIGNTTSRTTILSGPGKVQGATLTVYNATPSIVLIDSDTADKDAGVSIAATATTVTAGSEQVDATFAQQVAGSPVTFLLADADGSVTLGDGTRGVVLSGAVTAGDTTISDATPQLSFRDTSCAIARDNAYLLVAATDTGDGTEDADVTLYQHVAGAAVAFLASDADGSLTVGRSGQAIVLNGAVGDITMKDSTPVLSLIDTDAVDGDAGVSLTATCTTTTAGAEHVDATFTQQVGGSPVNFLVADADGSITLGDGTRAISLSGPVGDITIKDATPVLNFKDSSCAVSDVNAYIEAVATDTGDGSEDIDVYIYQQVGGTPFACFWADADGPVYLGYNGQTAVLNSTTIQGSSATLAMKDTDCAVSDVNFDIIIAATDVGDGTEDIDVTFSAQVAGNKVGFLTFDADGSIALGYNGQPAIFNSSRVQGSTPTFKIVDTDIADLDEGITFSATATATGAGAENVDFAIAQQISGSPVTFLNADADGQVSVGDGTRSVYVRKLQSTVTVVPNTGAATPAATDTGTVYSNEGDGDGSSVTLPTAAAGLQFIIYVQINQTLTVTANSGDTIRIGSSVTAAAGSITSNVIGSSVTLLAINATEWVATASVGSWSF